MDQIPAPNSRRNRLLLAVGGAVVLAVGIFVGKQCFGPAAASSNPEPVSQVTGKTPSVPPPATELPAHLFRDWNVPEVAFLLSGQTYAYLQPCGCSEPQYGGLVRRYNLMKMLEKKGWKIAGIDLGEIYPPKKGGGGAFDTSDGITVIPEQAMERFKTTLRAQEVMNYQDFGLGLPEMKMPLIQGLGQMLALNTKNPRPLSLELKDPNKVYEAFSVRPYDVITSGPVGNQVKVAVTSLVGDSVVEAMKGDPNVAFFNTPAMIRTLMPKLANEKVDVVIFLVQGTQKEVDDIAKLCHAERQKNPTWPNVDLIFHTSDFDTAPARPQLINGTDTRSIYPGHKGKDVGVLGLFRKPGGGFELKYELVLLSPEFQTPAGQENDHRVMDLVQEYAKTVKNQNFLDKYKPFRVDHPSQRSETLRKAGVEAKYVGTERCASCHDAEYEIWKKAVIIDEHGDLKGHAVGYKSLENAKNPNLRQFDPECVACHTTGFKYRTGYSDPPAEANAKQIEKHNEKLLHVGCESCHGPGSMHADNPNNTAYYPLINPIKGIDDPATPNAKVLADRFCQSCHDIENDVHWGSKKPFANSWAIVRHTRPKAAAPKAP